MSSVEEAKAQTKRRSRPLTATQERLLFGVLFAVAALVQIGAVWVTMVSR